MKKGLDFVLLFVVCVSVSGYEDVTLTTAVVKDETTPKPTLIHRRIQIDQNVEETSHSPLDLFRLRAQELRRTRIDIWNWDYWCQLQPKMGNCSQSMIRFYYDAQIDQCVTFTYTGCNGNKNNFATVTDCERYCKGAAFMSIKDTTNPSFCSLQPNAGLCMAMYFKFYYDVNDATCKRFIYGGCGGNQNRFDSATYCMNRCHQDA
ncbi:kunitz-type U19-barytoxin-Tl1a-like isoform X1 [Ostrinia furnacalis]|uniref:kunitz-type U19-barytoxin-Tl1a-like isoform X1 n=2 Tax=Ostrinia furnacalis TaxID=93504 RepID=UPI00103E6BDC|nr:kunitz-type U19-barytoxin-Tl1a-like isoform X1 [Ostrinia furnacalis]